jgi:hypothetical protein
MFWVGLGVGMFIGAFLGMLVMGLCVASKEADRTHTIKAKDAALHM